jgi:ketosteroid isomerase-like protein
MAPDREQLFKLYDAFNARDIEHIIAMMHPLVKWANGQFGGYVHGRDGVREYWKAQFQMIDPHLDPIDFEMDDAGRAVFTVRQKVLDLNGDLLLEKTVTHTFSFDGGLIRTFEIGDGN